MGTRCNSGVVTCFHGLCFFDLIPSPSCLSSPYDLDVAAIYNKTFQTSLSLSLSANHRRLCLQIQREWRQLLGCGGRCDATHSGKQHESCYSMIHGKYSQSVFPCRQLLLSSQCLGLAKLFSSGTTLGTTFVGIFAPCGDCAVYCVLLYSYHTIPVCVVLRVTRCDESYVVAALGS